MSHEGNENAAGKKKMELNKRQLKVQEKNDGGEDGCKPRSPGITSYFKQYLDEPVDRM